MSTPTRNQTFRFSCSEEENSQMSERIKSSGQNKNDFMISAVLDNSSLIYKNKIKNSAVIVSEISNEVNILALKHPEVDFTPVRKGVNNLCQQLS